MSDGPQPDSDSVSAWPKFLFSVLTQMDFSTWMELSSGSLIFIKINNPGRSMMKDSRVTLEEPAFLKFISSAWMGPFESDRP